MSHNVHEDVSEKIIALAWQGAKFGSKELAKLLAALLKAVKEGTLDNIYRGNQNLESLEKKYHGKQSIKDLYAQDAAITSLEITGSPKSFDRIARKYGIDYSITQISKNPLKHAVFFKSRDVDIMTQIFNTYANQQMNNPEKPNNRNRFQDIWESVKESIKNNIGNIIKPKDKGNEGSHETALTFYKGKQSSSRSVWPADISTRTNERIPGPREEKFRIEDRRLRIEDGANKSGPSNGHNKDSAGKASSEWMSNIEITNDNIKSFEWVAKKYDIEYSLKKIDGNPPTHIVFFKGKDTKVLTKGFKEYVKSQRTQKQEKPSLRERVKELKEVIKNQFISKTKVKNKGLEK